VYTRVLLCYDGTLEGRRALRQGADVVLCMKSQAHLLAICRSLVTSAIPEGVTPELVKSEDERANALLEEGVQWLRERGVTAQGSLEYGNAVDLISATAQRIGADLIVVGHRPRGRLARWWSESDEESLLEKVSCSLLVAADIPSPLGEGQGEGRS
jgi:nucleotide-binding universal stress UspA family protein